ncbi:antibiotic biosynthesis monooxygenase [Evansella sp. LMS18]|uniref:antibiotic biosynthesis monooxygenase family protein n=1 Tax=Evansella sp. LMS18 TaxID=2924033 RepID=UPI0020D0AAB0|nr:antibiotic biosynthesis monooxygenase family protein [Evansella sp. LMS18]UTR11486.1 antibiotic biosynthesis monooxygenase [Evansella sp. LMS18]
MYIVTSTVTVPEEKTEEVINIYRNRTRGVDKAEGFLSFQLLQNDKKPQELTVHLEWETKENYLAWVTSDEYKKIHELEKKYPDKELASIVPKVSRYKVVAR